VDEFKTLPDTSTTASAPLWCPTAQWRSRHGDSARHSTGEESSGASARTARQGLTLVQFQLNLSPF
jgi:hypothetical protein